MCCLERAAALRWAPHHTVLGLMIWLKPIGKIWLCARAFDPMTPPTKTEVFCPRSPRERWAPCELAVPWCLFHLLPSHSSRRRCTVAALCCEVPSAVHCYANAAAPCCHCKLICYVMLMPCHANVTTRPGTAAETMSKGIFSSCEDIVCLFEYDEYNWYKFMFASCLHFPRVLVV